MMARKTFLRRTWSRYSKLGKGRKKKQTWRRPTGRDNKMREKRRGYSSVVAIGHKDESEKIIQIKNVSDLEKVQKDMKIILANVGGKKRIEIAKKAKEKKINFSNFNPISFLKQVEKENKKSEQKIKTTKKDSKTKEEKSKKNKLKENKDESKK